MIFFKIFGLLGADFVVYYEAAWVVFQNHANPYLGLITRSFPFNYPPTSLLLLWPLAFLNFKAANILWNISSIFSVFLTIFLLLKLILPKLNRKIFLLIFLVLSFAFTIPFFPVKFNIGNGQINHFLLLLFTLSLYLYQTGRKKASAFFLALATAIKLAPAVLILYFLIKRDYRQIGYLLLFLALFVLISLLYLPLNFQLTYLTQVAPMSFTLAAKDWYYNQSLEGFLTRSLTQSPIILTLTYFLSGLSIVLTWWRGRKINAWRAISAVTLLYLLIHPIALQHYFGFAIIPLILLGVDFWRTHVSAKHWLLLIVAYILLALDIKNFTQIPKEFNFLLSHDFFAVLLLWLLALWKENISKALALVWVGVIIASYLSILLCQAKLCP
ncbi:MAG: hypothetical protein UY21_C0011G0026 [Microgenomates group bacterium GW2011_GWA1_48_10]|uniref:DUF2029 domain-containing protein n=1 Tax=Candidatus Gottesmanbacteria bacterium RIFCSPHIGHO2_01_FULL_47_48 TaxID=1798381 RepID=A0A1F6A4V5_9BACT|nr:MAG: hypothetical protein UY21_C0011G0026 [Microgenomates group bacterium GW2011_GWA1_48_10]OGG19729.1 MAG: hypothetical protein A2721_01080 [Candidatus Gottesmanbacteria bacterium RIFCSPHIGHO2_01_FULL_47_48]